MAQANVHPTSVARTGPDITLAKYYARKRIIEAAKAAGIRYRELSAADITRSAVAYLDGPHGPELIAKATQTLFAFKSHHLGSNPLTVDEIGIREIKSLMTMVGGRIVYETLNWFG
jgi:hypothetical protein